MAINQSPNEFYKAIPKTTKTISPSPTMHPVSYTHLLHLGGRTLGDQAAKVQHIDPVGNIHHQIHVVLDHEHRQSEIGAEDVYKRQV